MVRRGAAASSIAANTVARQAADNGRVAVRRLHAACIRFVMDTELAALAAPPVPYFLHYSSLFRLYCAGRSGVAFPRRSICRCLLVRWRAGARDGGTLARTAP